MMMTFSPSSRGEELGEAEWIWSDDPGTAPDQWRWFRCEFDGAADVAGVVTLKITADSRYRVWLDGELVGDGPGACVPWRQLVDHLDLTDRVRPGRRHCLAVVVNSLGRLELTRAGMAAAVVTDDGITLCASGPHWRVAGADAYLGGTLTAPGNRVRPYLVIHDQRRVRANWDRVGFDDHAWEAATPLGRAVSHSRPPVVGSRPEPAQMQPIPWSALVHEPLPRSETVHHPVRIVQVEECLDLNGRDDPRHLLVGLSQPGRPVRATTVDTSEDACGVGSVHLTGGRTGLEGTYDPCLTIDFGTEVVGWLEIDITGPSGATVDLGFAERLIDGWFSVTVEGGFAERFVLDGRRQRLRSWHWHALRYLRLRVRHCGSAVDVHELVVRDATVALFRRGRFTGPEPWEKVFEICRSTVVLCCVDGMVDTPWREAGQWLGDASAITGAAVISCFGEASLVEAFLRRAAACGLPSGLLSGVSNAPELRVPQGFADFSLWWITAVWHHAEWTGDFTVARDLFGVVRQIIDAFPLDVDGAVAEVPHPVFIDWSPVVKSGQLAFVNALFAEALRCAIAVAEAIGELGVAAALIAMRGRVQTAFGGHFFDRASGVVVDVADRAAGPGLVSEAANAAAVAFGMLPRIDAESVCDHLWGDSPTVKAIEAEPFISALILRALVEVDQLEWAIELIDRRWGDRFVRRDAQTTYEEWSPNGSWRSGEFRGFMRSMSHAWSAGPADFLLRVLPGIEIVEPGCSLLRIGRSHYPFDFTVEWPTPHGTVTVSVTDGQLVVDAPDGVTVIEAPDTSTVPSPPARPRSR